MLVTFSYILLPVSFYILPPNIWLKTSGNMWRKATRVFWCLIHYHQKCRSLPRTLKASVVNLGFILLIYLKGKISLRLLIKKKT